MVWNSTLAYYTLKMPCKISRVHARVETRETRGATSELESHDCVSRRAVITYYYYRHFDVPDYFRLRDHSIILRTANSRERYAAKCKRGEAEENPRDVSLASLWRNFTWRLNDAKSVHATRVGVKRLFARGE